MTAANPTGQLFTVSAPSGAGKTSLVKALVETDPHIRVSVSHTTRAKRPGEQDGVNYHFVSRDDFERERDAGVFFEWAEVFGNLYGTSRHQVDQLLAEGFDVILEIDWQGAQQVQASVSNCCSVSILPPSIDALAARLSNRGQDDEATIQRRMAQAQSEIEHCLDGEFIVLNDDFETALAELRAIFTSQRLRNQRQHQALKSTLDGLLAPLNFG